MAEEKRLAPVPALARDYQDALVASGLVDDLTDLTALEPKPYRFAEGEFICRHGDLAECLWVIVTGSVAVKDRGRTLFVRRRNEVVGEQNLLGNGYRRMYDLEAGESSVEVLVIDKKNLENHSEKETIWRNIARIISLKLKAASSKVSSINRQLEDDIHILHAYTNQYALSRRLQSGSKNLAEYKVDKAIVWFSDVVDFSQYALTLSPDRTADIVQRFFNAQSIPIQAHGGYIDKFIGDGLMAFWVVPEGTESKKMCLEALRAAEEAVREVSEISIGQMPLRLRIGVHVGLVLTGDFGSTTRHQFTLIGPEVNKAARLEQVHREDVIEGSKSIGDIRLSREFRNELSQTVQRKYAAHSMAKAKNIGQIELFS